MTYRDLLYDVSDNIAPVTLNRPDRLNAISGGMLASFSDAFREADRDRNVRAIILPGTGDTFTSGNDVRDFQARAGLVPDGFATLTLLERGRRTR